MPVVVAEEGRLQ